MKSVCNLKEQIFSRFSVEFASIHSKDNDNDSDNDNYTVSSCYKAVV